LRFLTNYSVTHPADIGSEKFRFRLPIVGDVLFFFVRVSAKELLLSKMLEFAVLFGQAFLLPTEKQSEFRTRVVTKSSLADLHVFILVFFELHKNCFPPLLTRIYERDEIVDLVACFELCLNENLESKQATANCYFLLVVEHSKTKVVIVVVAAIVCYR